MLGLTGVLHNNIVGDDDALLECEADEIVYEMVGAVSQHNLNRPTGTSELCREDGAKPRYFDGTLVDM